MKDFQTITTEIRSDVLIISLNRPEKKNAFNLAMLYELSEVFVDIDESLKLVILKGAGTNFCTGADINWMKESGTKSEEENFNDGKAISDLLQIMRNCRLPIITLANGPIYGGALGLLAASDIVYADKKATFCFSEVKLGIIPATIMPFVLNRSGRKALPWMMSAKVFDTNIAKEMSLVEFIVDFDQIDDHIDKIISEYSSSGPMALKELKRLSNSFLSDYSKLDLLESVKSLTKLKMSPEGQEGLSAFIEKRKPNWIK